METRTIEQVKIYKLMLNCMTGKSENVNICAIAYDVNILKAWYDSLTTEPYHDGNWYKVFKKDSPLEMYNPIDWNSSCGAFEEWVILEDVLAFSSRYNIPIIETVN